MPAPELIRFDQVSKRFAMRTSARQRAREILLGQSPPHEHWALRDIDLSIAKGETVAIVGANGAGKSTLLALVAGASAPTHGSVKVAGRVSALLELSAGFHPDWTCRQNAEFQIRLRGHGRREAAAILEEVEAFADIGAYFDQPLRACSTGMALRVAFAAAVCVEPDILVVDEALAVGDTAFQHKCFRKLNAFRERGVTILLVTHRLELVPQLCSRALFLKHGQLLFDGAPGEVLRQYALSEFAVPEPSENPDERAAQPHGFRFGEGGARIEATGVSARDGVMRHESGETALFDVVVDFDRDVEAPLIGFNLRTVEDVILYATSSALTGSPLAPARKSERRAVRIEVPLRLTEGTFFTDFSICEGEGETLRVLDALAAHIRLDISGRPGCGGIIDLDARMRVEGANG